MAENYLWERNETFLEKEFSMVSPYFKRMANPLKQVLQTSKYASLYLLHYIITLYYILYYIILYHYCIIISMEVYNYRITQNIHASK